MKIEIIKQNGYNFLWINDYLWMWDIPIEQKIQKRIANEAYGDVLVAGYGLGIIQKYLLENKNVNSVVTIEKYFEIKDACLKEYGKLYGSINCMDFFDFGCDIDNSIAMKYDCIIGDIWEDIIPEQLKKYKKFKTKAETLLKPNGKILAWGKDYFEYLIKERNYE